MAELVGLAVSIIAIAGVADTALKMAKSMRRLSRDLGAARKDIKEFASKIEAFSSIVGAAHYSLDTHAGGSQPQSNVLVFIHNRKVLDQLVDQSEHVIDHIEEIWPRIKSLKSHISLITRLKWILRRADITALGPKMESVKTSLTLVITLVSFETLMQSSDRVGAQERTWVVEREMKRLRRDMKRLSERMVELQDQQERSPLQNLEDSENTFGEIQMDIQAALRELGNRLVKIDITPDMEHSSTSSTSSQMLQRNINSYATSVATEHSRNSPAYTSRHLRRRRSPMRSQIPRQTVIERAPSLTHTEIVTDEDVEQESPGSEPEEPGFLDLRRLPTGPTDAGEGSTTLTVEDHPEFSLSTSRPSAEEDFISVHPTTYHLEFNPRLKHSIKGYINTTNGWKSVTALLDPELPQNLISRAYAMELGLDIQLPDEAQEAFWVRLDNRQERKSTGSTVMEWSQGAFLDGRAFRVLCLVHDRDEIKTIVFGAPFLNKRKHYLQRAGPATETKDC